HLRGCHPLWPAFPDRSINTSLSLVNLDAGCWFLDVSQTNIRQPTSNIQILWSCNPALSFRIARFRLFRVRSPLLSESRLFSLPRGTEMVHFPPFAPNNYEFIIR